MPRLYTLGRFELVDVTPGASGRHAPLQPKRLALLAYLSIDQGVYHRRDTLLGLLWPDLGTEEGRRALRQALHYLRQHVGDAIATRSDDQVAVTDSLWCDASHFQRHVENGRDNDALDLYQGDFLEGVFLSDVAPEFEEWLYQTRMRLRSLAGVAAARLSEREQLAGNTQAAAAAAVRAHQLDPDDEAALRRSLELLMAAGDRSRALRVYDDFAKRLAAQFDATPSAETVALIDGIRAQPHIPGPVNIGPDTGTAARATIDSQPIGDSAAEPAPPLAASKSLRVAVVAALLIALSIGAVLWRSSPDRRVAAIPAPERLLVADLANLVDDSVLVRALSEAIRIDLAQSRAIQVMSPRQMATALRLAERSPGELALSDSLARELAAREGVKAIVSGEVARIGSRYAISARVVSTDEGLLVASARETADSAGLIDAVGRLTRTLRGNLGENVRSLRSSPPLSRVTTASLAALRKYSEAGFHADEKSDRASALRLLEEAIAIDSGFATAYRFAGALYAAEADPGRSKAALAKAFANRDRLPFYERHLTMGSYYRNVTREYDKAIAAYRSLLELYPDDKAALNNLSLVYAQTREFARADTLLLRVIAIDSTIPTVHFGLAQSYINQGKFSEARNALDRIAASFPGNPITPMTETYLAAARQDWESAERHIRERLRGARDRNRPAEAGDAHQTLGQILIVTGRIREAEHELRSAMAIAESAPTPRRFLFNAVQLGWIELRYRQRPERALRIVDSAMRRMPLAGIASEDRPYAELTEILVAAGDVETARSVFTLAASDSSARIDVEGPAGRMMAGFIAAGDGRYRTARSELRAAGSTDRCPICVLPAIGELYERTADPEGATVTYERYLSTPWMWRFETDAPHLGWTMLRLIKLYEKQGKATAAAELHSRLLRLWSKADPEVLQAAEKARQAP